MSVNSIYLAGPITGMSAEQCSGWRERVRVQVGRGIEIVSPLRDAADFGDAAPAGPEAEVAMLRHMQATITRDRWDVARCTLLLANFTGAKQISVGTVGEVFWADAFRKPIVIVRDLGNPHDTFFLNAITPWVFEELDAAVAKINTLLG
jgi:hypothetical protein